MDGIRWVSSWITLNGFPRVGIRTARSGIGVRMYYAHMVVRGCVQSDTGLNVVLTHMVS